jgi:hypothetical protein
MLNNSKRYVSKFVAIAIMTGVVGFTSCSSLALTSNCARANLTDTEVKAMIDEAKTSGNTHDIRICILQYLNLNNDATNKDIITALRARGFDVSALHSVFSAAYSGIK